MGRLKRWMWRLLGRDEDGYPRRRVFKTEEIKIVEPDAAEMQEGLAQLERCLPYWRNMPGLLVMKPELAVIVSVVDVQHDRMGFALTLSIDERIATPPDYPNTEINLDCVWNQPYMSISESCLSAPYGFYLHFGSEGVARVREKAKKMRETHGSEIGQMVVLMARHWFKGRMLED